MSIESCDNANNTNINQIKIMITPDELIKKVPCTEKVQQTVVAYREAIKRILTGEDHRLLVICGPCSIHDTEACMTYAERLKELADRYATQLLVVMRTYFEKPRTTVGWKGFINDPRMDGSCDINDGLHRARQFLLDVNAMGLPVGVEFLDTITPQYYADLVSWGAIGARTTESQLHRQLASGLSMPVGFKNGTDGSIEIAADAIKSAQHPHVFPGITVKGTVAVVETKGNPMCHLILRGGNKTGPQYTSKWVELASKCMQKRGSDRPNVIVDCSHGNSQKLHTNQIIVARDIAQQITRGETRIVGVMLESHIKEGSQTLPEKGTPLEYGKSVTDACINLETTEIIFKELSESIEQRLVY